MKKLLIVFLAMLIVTPAYADRDRDGHYWHGGGYHDGGWWLFPALVGGAIFYDVTRPQPPVVYVQPAPAPVVAPAPQQYWYFCPEANAYYPYVASCPGGWQPVPVKPSAPAVPGN